MTRRQILRVFLAAVGLWSGLKRPGFAAKQPSMKEIEELRKNWRALLADGVKVALPSEPLKLSKDEWRKRLNAAQFDVLREEGTERPGTSLLNGEKRPGVFTCVGCGLPQDQHEHQQHGRHAERNQSLLGESAGDQRHEPE